MPTKPAPEILTRRPPPPKRADPPPATAAAETTEANEAQPDWLVERDEGKHALSVTLGTTSAERLREMLTRAVSPKSLLGDIINIAWETHETKRKLKKRRNGQECLWARIPLEARLSIVADLKERPFPWIGAHKELAKKHGVSNSSVGDLVRCVALYGFDDPGLNGKKPKRKPKK